MSSLGSALAQRRVLAEGAHRPWPLPERRWFMGQTWRHLLFAHWRVDPELLGTAMPPQLPLDTRDGAAWVGVTPFLVEGLHLRGFPPPPLAGSFREVNVRTYVIVDGRPGIYFFSLDSSSRLAVKAARRGYRLPYFHSRMSLVKADDTWHAQATRLSKDGPPAELECRYAPAGDQLPNRPDSLERWLSERYCLYTLDARGVVQRGEIHHPPWPLRAAWAEFGANTMAAGLPFELEGEPLCHFSERQDVLLWTIEPA